MRTALAIFFVVMIALLFVWRSVNSIKKGRQERRGRNRCETCGKVGDANRARHLFCRDDCAALCVEVGQLDQEGPSREAWPEPLRNVREGRGCEPRSPSFLS